MSTSNPSNLIGPGDRRWPPAAQSPPETVIQARRCPAGAGDDHHAPVLYGRSHLTTPLVYLFSRQAGRKAAIHARRMWPLRRPAGPGPLSSAVASVLGADIPAASFRTMSAQYLLHKMLIGWSRLSSARGPARSARALEDQAYVAKLPEITAHTRAVGPHPLAQVLTIRHCIRARRPSPPAPGGPGT